MRTLPGDYDINNKLLITSSTTIYRLWKGMKNRCNSESAPKYPYYGGKGIKVCEEWNKCFYSFYNYVSQLENFDKYKTDNYSIDRIKNDIGYEPNNIRWVSKTEQVINRVNYNKSTGFTGIRLNGKKGNTKKKYHARVFFEGKELTVGNFDTLEEAVIERNKFILDNNLPHKLQTFAENKRNRKKRKSYS